MKRVTFLFFALLTIGLVQAQDFYLPTTAASDEAEKLYHEGIEATFSFDLQTHIAKMKAATALDPNLFMSYFHGTMFAILMGQKDYSFSLIDKALAIDPTNFNKAEQHLRKVLEILKKDEEEQHLTPHFEALVADYPDVPEANLWALWDSYFSENYEKSKMYATTLLELAPDFGVSYNMLGYSEMALGNMDEAKKAFEKYIEMEPDNANAYDSMGEFYMNAEDYKKSAEFYQKAFDLGMQMAGKRAEKARSMIKK